MRAEHASPKPAAATETQNTGCWCKPNQGRLNLLKMGVELLFADIEVQQLTCHHHTSPAPSAVQP